MKRTLATLLSLTIALHAADPAIRGFSAAGARTQMEAEERARSIPDPDRIREYIRRIADQPHHAGSPGSKAVADYLLSLLRSWGLEASIEEFEALLPTPKQRTVEMISPASFRARLQEPVISEDKDSGDKGQLPTYNAYSPSGDVTAPLVYVNYGVPEDYKALEKLGVSVKGAIVLARYGQSWRGIKTKMAAEHGAVGCIIYSDPRDDGYFAGDVYPNGGFRPKDGVQRGSIIDMAIYPGDPLSPGWASEKGSRRLALTEARNLPKIPTLPISWSDAQPLLENLAGPVAPENWRGALPLTYHVGPGPARVHLALDFDWSTRPVYNVVVRIPGSQFPDQWVMYGNHHDAWVNGAADPSSGAAALLETARTLAARLKEGWKPKRTIVLALWDAEEFGLIGSTEWLEKHKAELDRKLVAYLNTDMNGRGRLQASGSPTLEAFFTEVARDVRDPVANMSVLEVARRPRPGAPKTDDAAADKTGEFHLVAPGSGSDYAAFVHHAGIAVINAAFSDDEARGIYHSIYDSSTWYEKFSDTTFRYGQALSQMMTISVLRLADAPLLPFEFARFDAAVSRYVEEILKLPDAAGKLRIQELRKELMQFAQVTRAFETRYKTATEKAAFTPPARLGSLNETLYHSERAMLRAQGLPQRDWFKHQIYAPGLYTGYSVKTLPGIREAAEAGRWDEANQQAGIVAEILRGLRSLVEEATRALGRL